MTSNPVNRAYRDAYRYRNQLREAEAERDQLRDKLEQVTRSTIEDIALGLGISRPDTLWKLGLEVAQVQGVSGTINHNRARHVILELAKENGLQINPAQAPKMTGSKLESVFES